MVTAKASGTVTMAGQAAGPGRPAPVDVHGRTGPA